MSQEIKVLVIVKEESNPELYAALQKISVRSRAERLRILATIASVHKGDSSGSRALQTNTNLTTTTSNSKTASAAKKLSDQF